MWKVFFTRAFLSQSGAAMKSSTNPSVRSRGRGHLRCSADARITDMATILGLLGAGPRPDCPYKHSCSLFKKKSRPFEVQFMGEKKFCDKLKNRCNITSNCFACYPPQGATRMPVLRPHQLSPSAINGLVLALNCQSDTTPRNPYVMLATASRDYSLSDVYKSCLGATALTG